MSDKKITPEPLTLDAARQQLTAAQAAYEQLAHTPTRSMPADVRAAHEQKCRQALSDKRYLTAAVEALRVNRPVPDRQMLLECRL